MQHPETGLVVSCEGDLAARYQSRGWVALDGAAKPATEVASEKPQKDKPSADEDSVEDKPVRRSQSRRR